MKITITKIFFPEIKAKQRDAHKLRGYFGAVFKEESTLLHNHFENGETIYGYPLVQYKIINNIPYLIGINEGANLLFDLFLRIKEIKINNNIYKIFNKQINLFDTEIGLSDKIEKYKFISIWLALNQANYKKYCSYIEEEDKIYLLEKIIIGNILSMYKYFGYRVEEKITAKIELEEKRAVVKGVDMLGFIGNFYTNAIIPSYLGLGKLVSRGFGSILRINKLV